MLGGDQAATSSACCLMNRRTGRHEPTEAQMPSALEDGHVTPRVGDFEAEVQGVVVGLGHAGRR